MSSETVVQEVSNEPKVGELVGQCKWWSDKLGYGFITVQQGDMKGKDIFVHHTGIRPLNSNYRTLKKGEYINFDVIEGDNGLQAVNVTGIGGGSLICDVNPYVKPITSQPPPPGATLIPVATAPGSHFRPYAPRTSPNNFSAYRGGAPSTGAPTPGGRRSSPFRKFDKPPTAAK